MLISNIVNYDTEVPLISQLTPVHIDYVDSSLLIGSLNIFPIFDTFYNYVFPLLSAFGLFVFHRLLSGTRRRSFLINALLTK